MATMFSMEAVQQNTSEVIQKSHISGPNVHTRSIISKCRLMGSTIMATSKSAMASDAISMFVRVLMSRNKNTDDMTRILPTRIEMINTDKTKATMTSLMVTEIVTSGVVVALRKQLLEQFVLEFSKLRIVPYRMVVL